MYICLWTNWNWQDIFYGGNHRVSRDHSASWKIGANGPTIVVCDNDSKEKISRKRKSRSTTGVMVRHDMVEHDDSIQLPDDFDSSSAITFAGEVLPEKLIATWKEGITVVGQDFKSVKEFRAVLQTYAVAHRFVYKLRKNDTCRASGICVVEGCPWKIHASLVPATQTFRIKKFKICIHVERNPGSLVIIRERIG